MYTIKMLVVTSVVVKLAKNPWRFWLHSYYRCFRPCKSKVATYALVKPSMKINPHPLFNSQIHVVAIYSNCQLSHPTMKMKPLLVSLLLTPFSVELVIPSFHSTVSFYRSSPPFQSSDCRLPYYLGCNCMASLS